jgi:hypothetical protein
MKLLKSIFFTLVLLGAMTAGIQAQANSLKEIRFFFDRTRGYDSTVFLKGDNIDVTARYDSLNAPYLCLPCTQNTVLQFGPAFDNSGIVQASGTIDGIFYQNLYVLNSLTYSSPSVRIPRLWSKSVRVSAPVTLSGNIGIWRFPQEVGNNSIALYLHNGINFNGRADLWMQSWFSGGGRKFGDRHLSLSFWYAGS